MRRHRGWPLILTLVMALAWKPAPAQLTTFSRSARQQQRRQLRGLHVRDQQTALHADRHALTDSAETPDGKRLRTAREVLDVIAGSGLQNKSRDSAIRGALHPIPLPPVAALADWEALAVNASRLGLPAVTSALSADAWLVPDVEGARGCRCQLTTETSARRFKRSTQLNWVAATLFESIASGSTDSHLPRVALNRYDLFHAHMFMTRAAPGRLPELGLLFHAKEYPRLCSEFPVNLGYCQANSTLAFNQRAMDFRNVLFYRGRLCALDVGEASPLHEDLLMDGLQEDEPGLDKRSNLY